MKDQIREELELKGVRDWLGLPHMTLASGNGTSEGGKKFLVAEHKHSEQLREAQLKRQ